jgi:hypothetical protein
MGTTQRRLTITNADAAKAMTTTSRLGTEICMPNATKNSVTKKSLMLTALAITSRL